VHEHLVIEFCNLLLTDNKESNFYPNLQFGGMDLLSVASNLDLYMLL